MCMYIFVYLYVSFFIYASIYFKLPPPCVAAGMWSARAADSAALQIIILTKLTFAAIAFGQMTNISLHSNSIVRLHSEVHSH